MTKMCGMQNGLAVAVVVVVEQFVVPVASLATSFITWPAAAAETATPSGCLTQCPRLAGFPQQNRTAQVELQ